MFKKIFLFSIFAVTFCAQANADYTVVYDRETGRIEYGYQDVKRKINNSRYAIFKLPESDPILKNETEYLTYNEETEEIELKTDAQIEQIEKDRRKKEILNEITVKRKAYAEASANYNDGLADSREEVDNLAQEIEALKTEYRNLTGL